MAILAECDICGNQHRVKDGLAGSSIHCKECGALFSVPRDEFITPAAFVEEGGRLRRRLPAPSGNQWAWFVMGCTTMLVTLALGATIWALIALNWTPTKRPACHADRKGNVMEGVRQ